MNEQRRAEFEGYCRAIGGVGNLRPAPDGPVLEAFNAAELAGALASELNRATGRGNTKVSLHFDIVDAVALANFLRRAVAAGVC